MKRRVEETIGRKRITSERDGKGLDQEGRRKWYK